MQTTAEFLMICDENYAPYTGTTLISLFKSNQHIDNIIIHLMTNHISVKSQHNLTSICNQYNRNIYFHDIIKINNSLKSANAPSYKGSYLPLIKLCFDEFKDMLITDRLIYLDSDLIINGKVDFLLNITFKNKICAMVNDTTVNSSNLYKKRLGLPIKEIYYNAGMMIFNTSIWFKNNSKEKIFSYIEKQQPDFPFFEQDLLNILFHDQILELPITYNYSATISDLGISASAKIYNWSQTYTNNITALSNDVIIYHCLPVKGSRPWMQNSIHPFKKLWDSNTNFDLWDTSQNPVWHPTPSDKLLLFIRKYCPMWMYIIIHRLGLHFYFSKLIKSFSK